MNHSRNGVGIQWRKSSRSSDSANCVEFALFSPDQVGLRDSKNPDAAVLTYSVNSWASFVAAVRAGEFDLPDAGR